MAIRTPLAWLNLVHEKTRLLVAIAGVAFAVMIIFMNLGFLGAIATSSEQVYTEINADIYLSSPQTLELSSTRPVPIERIYQAAGIRDVQRVMPLYGGYLQWRNAETGLSRPLFAYGFNPEDPVFLTGDLQLPQNKQALRRPNTVLVDRRSRPEYGPQQVGVTTEVDRRTVTIGGQYTLGGGFAADGTILMSDQNFRRYFAPRPLSLIDYGLIQITPGADPDQVAERLRQILPKDVEVLTQAQIMERDRRYWIVTTSTGFIFGMGVAVSCVVGVVIVYQILYTDIANHMLQYATLKAMGYRSLYLVKLVIQEALILAVLGYIPGFIISWGLYSLTLQATNGTMPIAMELGRTVFVFALAVLMCVVSGLISVQKVIQADPAEVF